MAVTIKYEENFKGEIFIATRNCSNEDYSNALNSAKMYTNCIHSAELRAAAVLCCCSPDQIESIEEWDAL